MTKEEFISQALVQAAMFGQPPHVREQIAKAHCPDLSDTDLMFVRAGGILMIKGCKVLPPRNRGDIQ